MDLPTSPHYFEVAHELQDGLSTESHSNITAHWSGVEIVEEVCFADLHPHSRLTDCYARHDASDQLMQLRTFELRPAMHQLRNSFCDRISSRTVLNFTHESVGRPKKAKDLHRYKVFQFLSGEMCNGWLDTSLLNYGLRSVVTIALPVFARLRGREANAARIEEESAEWALG